MKGQIMTGTMMWIAGLAIAGMTAFFNLKSDQAVLSERENNHFGQVQQQLVSVNEKLDILLGSKSVLELPRQTKK